MRLRQSILLESITHFLRFYTNEYIVQHIRGGILPAPLVNGTMVRREVAKSAKTQTVAMMIFRNSPSSS